MQLSFHARTCKKRAGRFPCCWVASKPRLENAPYNAPATVGHSYGGGVKRLVLGDIDRTLVYVEGAGRLVCHEVFAEPVGRERVRIAGLDPHIGSHVDHHSAAVVNAHELSRVAIVLSVTRPA